jgi:hypothetical protein
MPWGSVDLAEEVQFILSVFGTAPDAVLDVGVGFGAFGMTYRLAQLRMGSLIDKVNWNDHTDLMDRRNWSSTLDGIDARDYSQSPGWLFYNHVHIGEAIGVLSSMPSSSYDAVVANDIVEHFDAEQVGRFCSELKRVARSLVVVGYPLTVYEVEDEGVERHRIVVDPETILPAFTHRVNMAEGWAVSFKVLGKPRGPGTPPLERQSIESMS